MSETDFVYRCQKASDFQCAETCVGVEACDECQCSILPLEAGGPWGDVMDVRICVLSHVHVPCVHPLQAISHSHYVIFYSL